MSRLLTHPQKRNLSSFCISLTRSLASLVLISLPPSFESLTIRLSLTYCITTLLARGKTTCRGWASETDINGVQSVTRQFSLLFPYCFHAWPLSKHNGKIWRMTECVACKNVRPACVETPYSRSFAYIRR